MKNVAELDKNMAVMTRVDDETLVWRSAREQPFRLEGLYDPYAPGPYRRLPQDVAEATSGGVAELALCTAGGRVRFRTDSPYVAIHAEMSSVCRMDHMAFTGIFGFDLYVKHEGKWIFKNTFRPPEDLVGGYESKIILPAGENEVMINFPLYNGVDVLKIGLHRDCSVYAPCEYRHAGQVVYYGSSITQGGCASRPGNSYQAIISRMLDGDHINLGFSGNGRGEKAIVDYMARIPDMRVFVSDYDHNAPTPEHLQATHMPLYEAIRARNPELPIIFVTRPDIDVRVDAPEKIEQTAKFRAIVRATYDHARANGDERVAFIDGSTLFDGPMRDSCTVDGCHPNDLGFWRMANVIGAEVAKWL